MIYVVATIELNEGQRAAFLNEFQKLAPQVRAESGCLEYVAAIDEPTSIPIQEQPRANAVVVMEKWASVEALEAHLIAQHMVEYRQRVKDKVQATRLQILKPVE